MYCLNRSGKLENRGKSNLQLQEVQPRTEKMGGELSDDLFLGAYFLRTSAITGTYPWRGRCNKEDFQMKSKHDHAPDVPRVGVRWIALFAHISYSFNLLLCAFGIMLFISVSLAIQLHSSTKEVVRLRQSQSLLQKGYWPSLQPSLLQESPSRPPSSFSPLFPVWLQCVVRNEEPTDVTHE